MENPGYYKWIIASLVFGLFEIGPANSTPITASSSAFGELVSFTAAPISGTAVTVSSGPLPTTSGSAPAAYSTSSSAVSAFVTGVLSTGVLNSTAFSTVDGTAGAKITSASATVNGLSAGLLGAVGLTATTVQSTSLISGDFGSLTSLGSTTINNLYINGLAVDIGNTVNNVLFNSAGIKIVANEQIAGGSFNAPTLVVNAIDVTFINAVEVVNGTTSIVNGSVIIGHSQTQMTAAAIPVPEPSTAVLLGASLLGFFGVRHYQRQKT